MKFLKKIFEVVGRLKAKQLLLGGIFVATTLVFGVFLLWFYVLVAFGGFLGEWQKMLSYKSDTLTFYDTNGEVIYKTPGRSVDKIRPLSGISPDVKMAVLAAEDWDFYKHNGVSWKGVARAFYWDIRQRNIYHQGGSTITQQLARTVFLNNDKSVFRKLKETILALEIERRYSKDQILELYLNSVYLGAGAYGIEQASHTYFGKDPKDLNLSEAALLAGLPVAPSRFSPTFGDRDGAYMRQRYVLAQMVENGVVSEQEANEAREENLSFLPKQYLDFEAPHFVFYLKEQLKGQFPDLDLDVSGLKVYSTLDLAMQKRSETLIAERVEVLASRDVSNGAFLALNPQTGEILAMVGSVDYFKDSWGAVNVLLSPRSPGSSIKPVVYAAAIESGKITTATILHDSPTTYNNGWEVYTPGDADGKFRGPVLTRRALANSLNVPAVEVASKVGVAKILETASRMGISGLSDLRFYGLSIAVGGLEVRGLDLASSYAALANGGYDVGPFGIKRVEDKFGKVIYEPDRERVQVLDGRIAYIITNILADNEARREVFGSPNLLEIGRPAAVKTGTSEDFKNVWTVGYTPSLLTLVWFGNNDSTPMENIWGVESAAVVWNKFMREELAGTVAENFGVPSGIEYASICPYDGSLAVSGQPTVREVFIAGSVPQNSGTCAYFAQKQKEEQQLASAWSNLLAGQQNNSQQVTINNQTNEQIGENIRQLVFQRVNEAIERINQRRNRR